MKPVVRLQGADADVRAVAREAVTILQEQGGGGAFFDELRTLNEGRRRTVAAMRTPPSGTAIVAPEPTAGRAHRVVWGALLTLGLIAALTAAVMLGPAGRKNAFLSADLAAAVSLPAVIVAIAALLLALVIRPPDGGSARTGETMAVLVGIPVFGILVFRLIAGVGDGRGFSAATLAWWVPASAVVVLLLIGIVVRCDGVRRSADARAPRPRATAMSKDAVTPQRRTAERLAATAVSKEARQLWGERLAALAGRGIPRETVAQAESMTPAAWLAWFCYDGEIDVSQVIP